MTTTVRTPEELRAALEANRSDIRLGALYFESPEQAIRVGQHYKHNGLRLYGPGGCFIHDGAAIYRLYDDGPPPITFEGGREWELRLEGFICMGSGKRGTIMRIENCQQTLIRDVRVQGSEGEEPPLDWHIGGGSVIDYLQVFWNRSPVRIWDAGVVGINRLQMVTTWDGRAGDVVIIAPEHAPPPAGNSLATSLDIFRPHIEGSTLRIIGYDHAAMLDGGYYLSAAVHWDRCRHIGTNLTPYNTTWWKSEMYKDGVRIK
jgi:hypothetical protein